MNVACRNHVLVVNLCKVDSKIRYYNKELKMESCKQKLYRDVIYHYKGVTFCEASKDKGTII